MTRVVYIKWIDAHGGAGQHDLDYVKRVKMDEMKTAGILIEENENEVILVQDLLRVMESPIQTRCFEVIPRRNITHMEVWEVKEALNG